MITKKISTNTLWHSVVGWSGVGLILASYGALNFGFIDSRSLWYQFANLIGAVFLITTSLSKKDYEPFVLNLVWMVVAAIAIVRILWF